ncbi:MAG: YceI family protein, partial [Pseudomonadota bacterium]
PLSGWVMHAAEDGFAPIWWPFGQNLPFVPKSESWAMTAGAIHWAAGLLLGVTLAAHIAGALKHKLVDKDATLARMVSSTEAGDPAAQSPHGVTAFAGGAVWVVVLGLTLASIGLPGGTERVASAAAAPTLSEGTDPQSAVWTVQEVDLAFTVVQLGSDVTGHFEALSPSITYDPETGDGQVTVEIDMSSVTLGSVTDQAKGSEFFDVTNHPTAIFEATLTRDDGEAHIADGTLTLTGVSVPVSMPFTLSISDGTAEMTGGVTLDRRDFEIGTSYPDESSVGFSVGVAVTLTASQP